LTFVSDVEKYQAALAAVGAKPTSVAELLETIRLDHGKGILKSSS